MGSMRSITRAASAAKSLVSRIDGALTRARTDGWSNILSGLGEGGRDRRNAGIVAPAPVLNEAILSELYTGDPIARRICDLPANEMTREWIRFTSDAGADVNKRVHQALQVIDAQSMTCDAISWARLYGGALVLIGADDGGQLWQPLQERRIRSLDWLAVLDRYDVQIAAHYDELGPKFREAKFYRVVNGTGNVDYNDLIHESRVMRFDGVRTTRLRKSISGSTYGAGLSSYGSTYGGLTGRLNSSLNAGWSDSIFVAMFEVLRDFWAAFGGAAHILTDFSQPVMKMKGLGSLLAANQGDVVTRRLQIMDMARSLLRTVVVDAEEDFSRIPTPVNGLADLLDRQEQLVAAVSGTPVTLLMGRSPAGMSSTGDADIRFFYDSIRAQQEGKFRTQIERLIHLLLLAKTGPTRGKEPVNWSFKFNPLWQLDAQQEAERRNKQAQTDQIYIAQGVLHPEEVRNSRFGGDEYGIETSLDDSLGAMDDIQPADDEPATIPETMPGEAEE
jgi:uncharacterized protein